MADVLSVPVTGRFTLEDGSRIPGFWGEISGVRDHVAVPGWWRDLGPVHLGLGADGMVGRLRDDVVVPLELLVPAEGGPFHYNVRFGGVGVETVEGGIEVTGDPVDLPNALLEVIPEEDIPRWLEVQVEVQAHAQSAIQAAGLAAADATAARDARTGAKSAASAAALSATAAQETAESLYLTVEYDPVVGFTFTQGGPVA